MSDFKDMLKYFREREHLSQKELAEKLGISASTISMYEVGSRHPDFETEEAIADFFNTDLNTLRGKRLPELSKAYEHSDFLNSISDNEIELLKRIRALEAVYTPEQIERGLEFIALYQNAIPEIQTAVESLLKSQKRDS